MANRAAPAETSPRNPSGVPSPDLVVMLTTATGLPPNSAGTPPVMTAMLSTWAGSRELEKVAWTWSVTGTPSMTYITCPWLPRKWKRPFSSWMNPGVASRMFSSPRLCTTSGALSMVLRSISWWEEVRDCTRLASASTTTVAPGTCSAASNSTGTLESTVTVPWKGWKPPASTSTR